MPPKKKGTYGVKEEIDVETVYGESKKPSSRSSSSSGGVLPTNPSFSDRQQLQLTMATAISKKDLKRQSGQASATAVPPRFNLDERTLKPKTLNCKRKVNVRGDSRRTCGAGNKRSAQYDDYGEYVNKSIKRRKYQYQRHFKSGKSKKPRNRRNYMRNGGALSSESDVDSSEKRTIHNSMERQRRIDLRNAFEELRKLVPFTAGNEKAPKVVILSYGAEFCKSLTMEETELTRKKAELRRQQEMLRAKVSQLRRSLAARR
ncbi:hypothetical protein RUM44_004794 [Polyplax serrata]|uniref:BHLH domain-containing protein n=1 Tax=Polyplax serrata TaxID=468196 RepID=A0ABR1B4K1_POLSC